MNTNHTPGPWAYFEDGDANCFHVRDNTGRWLLALRHNGEDITEQQRANMRLIAAAPDLLDALDQMLRAYSNVGGVTERQNARIAANKAMAKASQDHDPITAYYTDRANGAHSAKAAHR